MVSACAAELGSTTPILPIITKTAGQKPARPRSQTPVSRTSASAAAVQPARPAVISARAEKRWASNRPFSWVTPTMATEFRPNSRPYVCGETPYTCCRTKDEPLM